MIPGFFNNYSEDFSAISASIKKREDLNEKEASLLGHRWTRLLVGTGMILSVFIAFKIATITGIIFYILLHDTYRMIQNDMKYKENEFTNKLKSGANILLNTVTNTVKNAWNNKTLNKKTIEDAHNKSIEEEFERHVDELNKDTLLPIWKPILMRTIQKKQTAPAA